MAAGIEKDEGGSVSGDGEVGYVKSGGGKFKIKC